MERGAGRGADERLPTAVDLPIFIGAALFFANLRAPFGVELFPLLVAFGLGAAGLAVARARGVLGAALRQAVAAYAMFGCIALAVPALGPLSWWQEMVAGGLIGGVVFLLVYGLSSAVRAVLPRLRGRSGGT